MKIKHIDLSGKMMKKCCIEWDRSNETPFCPFCGFKLTDRWLNPEENAKPKRRGLRETEIDINKTLHGSIRIIEVRNVASYPKIKEKFGQEVMHDYYCSKTHYYVNDGSYGNCDYGIVHVIKNGIRLKELRKGVILSEEEFEKIIDTMKESAKQLRKCRDHNRNNQIETVKI